MLSTPFESRQSLNANTRPGRGLTTRAIQRVRRAFTLPTITTSDGVWLG